MRIALDARAASHPQRGGFKTYTEGLIQGLAEVDGSNQYVLYVDRDYHPGFPLPKNFDVKVVSSKPRLIGAGWREQVALPRLLRRGKYDLAHFPCNTAPMHYSIPFVVTIHDLIPVLYSPRVLSSLHRTDLHQFCIKMYVRALIGVAARQARRVITVSQASRQDLIERYHIIPEKILVVPQAPGVAFKPHEPSQARQIVASEFGIREEYLLALGSADPRKNVTAVIQVYADLPSALREKYRLVLVLAHATLRERIRSLIAVKGLVDRVTVLVNPPELVGLYNAATVFVFPSLYEGFGMPVLEAMACGTPVVASNCSSIPEVVGEAALLVDPTQSAKIAEAVQKILADDVLRMELRDRGLRRAAQFSWERTARETLRVYESCPGYSREHQAERS